MDSVKYFMKWLWFMLFAAPFLEMLAVASVLTRHNGQWALWAGPQKFMVYFSNIITLPGKDWD